MVPLQKKDMEVWKDIPGFENYQISNYGNVKSLNYGRTGKPKLLKPTVSGKGYLQVRLSKSGKPNALLVHRLVAMAFVQNLNNRKQINHKDENKFNNNADNLEWCDNQYNNTYNGKHNKIAKPVIQRSKAGNEIARYESIREAERKTGIKNITITRCCKGVYKTAGGYVWEYDLTIKGV